MTPEQFLIAIRLHERLEALGKVKKEIEQNRLLYAREYDNPIIRCYSKWESVGEHLMHSISDILDRHDKMIREEIDEEIAKIKRQIEEL